MPARPVIVAHNTMEALIGIAGTKEDPMLSLFKNIHKGLEEYKSTPGAVLLDMREEDEYRSGHIPGARNVPLSAIATADLPADLSTPMFLYCLSGNRSGRAETYLKGEGYVNVKNIGGINSYKGEIEK